MYWDGTGQLETGLEASVQRLLIDLTALSPAERRDLANALLRAAWSDALEETQIMLLDLLLEIDPELPQRGL